MKFLALALLVACGTKTPQKAETDTDTEQEACDLFAPTGEFTMTFQTVDSTCGGMGETQVQVAQGIVIPVEAAKCRLVGVDWDEGPCVTHSAFDCDDGLWEMLLDWRVIPDSDDSFSGTLDTTMFRFTGWNCAGQYDLDAVRTPEE